jgi:hypothetical protein
MCMSLIRGRRFRRGFNSGRLTSETAANRAAQHPGHLQVLVIDDDAQLAETAAVFAACGTDNDIRAGLRPGWWASSDPSRSAAHAGPRCLSTGDERPRTITASLRRRRGTARSAPSRRLGIRAGPLGDHDARLVLRPPPAPPPGRYVLHTSLAALNRGLLGRGRRPASARSACCRPARVGDSETPCARMHVAYFRACRLVGPAFCGGSRDSHALSPAWNRWLFGSLSGPVVPAELQIAAGVRVGEVGYPVGAQAPRVGQRAGMPRPARRGRGRRRGGDAATGGRPDLQLPQAAANSPHANTRRSGYAWVCHGIVRPRSVMSTS